MLKIDSNFLKSHKLMDYSLYLAVEKSNQFQLINPNANENIGAYV